MFINGNTCVTSCGILFSRGNRCVLSCYSSEFVFGKICLATDCASNNLFRLGDTRTCLESCPVDAPLVTLEGKTCVKSCPADAPLLSLEKYCVKSCPSGQYQFENKCVSDCQAIGKVIEDGQCVEKCSSDKAMYGYATYHSADPDHKPTNLPICIADLNLPRSHCGLVNSDYCWYLPPKNYLKNKLLCK